ncbi:hypothetical protein L7F22_014341 [Adiantum nelumboides]|nr:hypothetical protein [Adiantum nelumboides]
MLKLQDYVAIIEKENERSKQECARLSRIVESGEWARQQVAEILEAKDVLSVEREALAALISRLNQQQTAVLEQREKNDNEMQHFKDKLFGSNFINHNKLLIKGASSFNTVVRALKTDALKRGVHPEFLCAVDRLAMDKVSVFPDGEIRVKTFCNFEKGKWMPKQELASYAPAHGAVRSQNFSSKEGRHVEVESAPIRHLDEHEDERDMILQYYIEEWGHFKESGQMDVTGRSNLDLGPLAHLGVWALKFASVQSYKHFIVEF